jgi:hypothetical protein
MKIFKLLALVFLPLISWGQSDDATLTTQNNTTIFGQTYSPVRAGNMYQGIINSKVSLLGTYSNPSWLSALAWSKITGTPTTLAGYGITNGVTTGRTITINGVTFDLSANRTWTVGDLLSSGSYSNPSWITTLDWSKITGYPNTLSGYGITDGVSTSGSYSNPAWLTSLSAGKITGTLFETQGGTGFASYTTGDILYSSAANTLNKLGIGAEGEVLTVSSGIPSWEPSSGGIDSLSNGLTLSGSIGRLGGPLTNPTYTKIGTSYGILLDSSGTVYDSQFAGLFNGGFTGTDFTFAGVGNNYAILSTRNVSEIAGIVVDSDPVGLIQFWNSSERFRISNTGAFGIGGANYGSAGQVFTSNGSGAAPSWNSISSTLAALTDVTLTSLATNDFLKYNGSAWINRTPANVRTDLGLDTWSNIVSNVTGTAPYWSLASGGTLTATNTLAANFPLIFNSNVTTGTGATAGMQITGNSLTTGNLLDVSTTSLTSGKGLSVASTSTAINHTAGTNSVGWFETSGANANVARTAIALSGKATNTNATSGTNIGVYGAASNATTANYAGYFDGNVYIVGTTLSGNISTDNFFNVFGALPASRTTGTAGARLEFTTSGSDTENLNGLTALLSGTYSGSGATSGGAYGNNTIGTNSDSPDGTNNIGNNGFRAYANGTTIGHNYGATLMAEGGNRNIGGIGIATTAKNNASNFGLVGMSNNSGSSSGHVGVYATLAVGGTALPTGLKGGLVVSNGATTDPIAVFRDNNTVTSQLLDGGSWLIGSSGSITANTRLDVLGPGTTTANILRLANSANTARYTLNDQGDATLTGKMNIVGTALSGGSATDNWLNVTGTLPTVSTNIMSGGNFQITSAGSSAQNQYALNVDLYAGWTGSASSQAGRFVNVAAGTGSTYLGSGSGNYAPNTGNRGLTTAARATTTGTNIGNLADASGGNTNYGIWSSATTAKNSAINVGAFITGLNTGTTPTYVGAFIGNVDYNTSAPTLTNSALILDNGSTTAAILTARDNGTAVVTIADGGLQTNTAGLNLSGASSPLQVGGSAGTSGQVLTSAGAGATPTWTTLSGVIGGSTGSTDNSMLRADGTGGATLQNSGVIVDDTGNMTIGTDANTARTITAGGSNSNVSISIDGKGTGGAFLRSTSSAENQVSVNTSEVKLTSTTAAIRSTVSNSTTTGSVQLFDFEHNTTGTAANDLSGYISISTERASGLKVEGTRIESVLADATNADFNSKLQTMSNAVSVDRLGMLGKNVTLTESTATTFATIAIATGTVVGAEVLVTVEANDGTDFQALTTKFVVTAVNKAGTLTISLNSVVQSLASSSGLLTVAITAVDGGSGVLQLKADAASSLTQTTLRAQSVIIKNFNGSISN